MDNMFPSDNATCPRCGADLPVYMRGACPRCGTISPAISEAGLRPVNWDLQLPHVSPAASFLKNLVALIAIFAVAGALIALYFEAAEWQQRLVDWWQTTHPHMASAEMKSSGSDLIVANAHPSAGIQPLHLPSGNAATTRFLSQGIHGLDDMQRVHLTLRSNNASNCGPDTTFHLTDTFAVPAVCLVEALTDTDSYPYRLRLVDFAKSNNRVFRVLRNDFHIPPPQGFAVVRIFDGENPLPPSLYTFHISSPETVGACFAGRFVAIFEQNADVEDVVSHELVHAYLVSAIGIARDSFPEWFHEGLALNIARNPYQTAEMTGDGLRIKMLTAQYQEYKHLFDRIERHLGRARYMSVIASCIATRSLDPLYTAARASDYTSLVDFANSWSAADARRYALLAICLACMILPFVRRRKRRVYSPRPAPRPHL